MLQTSVTVDGLEALVSSKGQALLDRLTREEPAVTDSIRLSASLRKQFPPELVAAALTQHELRRAAASKFSKAGQRETLAVDLDEMHLRMAVLNVEVYGVATGVRTVHADVRSVDLAGIDAVFVDPARRSGGRRLRTGQSESPLEWCLGLAQTVPAVGIKLAPGLDRDAVPLGWELEFLADGRDLKEAVAWSPALATAARRATILPGRHTLTPCDGAPVPVRPPGGFLLDPNPAVTRAGLVEELARATGCWKIDNQIAFLSADHMVRTAFARTLRVIESAPWKEKQLAARLRALDIGAIDIRRRGLAGDVMELHRRLKLRGTRRATLVMTRMLDQPWSLVCVDVDQPVPG